MTHNMEIEIEQEGDVYVVVVQGRIDATTSSIVEKKLNKIYDIASKIVMDFTDVDYLSSAGIRLLLQLTKKMQSKEGGIALFGLSEYVYEIICMAGFDRVLTLFKNKPDALKSLK